MSVMKISLETVSFIYTGEVKVALERLSGVKLPNVSLILHQISQLSTKSGAVKMVTFTMKG